MPSLLSEEFVKNRVIEWLGREGYRVISVKGLSEHGLDIRAKRFNTNYYYCIEAKGDPKVNPEKMRYPYLVSALGEMVQRVTKAKYCRYAVALPKSYEQLVRRRVPAMALRRLDLEFLLVNNAGDLKRITWKELLS